MKVPLVICYLLGLFLVEEATAFCCVSDYGLWGQCADCTMGTPYCATEPCNIFGCNCGGECRTGSCIGGKSRGNVDKIFGKAEINSDNVLSFPEAKAYLNGLGFNSRLVLKAILDMDLTEIMSSPGMKLMLTNSRELLD